MDLPSWECCDYEGEEEEGKSPNRLSESLSKNLSIDNEVEVIMIDDEDEVEHFGVVEEAIVIDDDEEEEEEQNIIKDLRGNTEMDIEENVDDGDSDGDGVVEDRSAGGRYFGGGEGGQKCFNCGIAGHISRDCPETAKLPCSLCGIVGHARFQCPEELCHNCGRVGHISRECDQPRKRRFYEGDTCHRCEMPGHSARECSLQWRLYKFAKPLSRQDFSHSDSDHLLNPYCYNCASHTHYGDECRHQRRFMEYSIFHHPDYHFLKLADLSRFRQDQRYNNKKGTETQRHQGGDEIKKKSNNNKNSSSYTTTFSHPSSSRGGGQNQNQRMVREIRMEVDSREDEGHYRNRGGEGGRGGTHRNRDRSSSTTRQNPNVNWHNARKNSNIQSSSSHNDGSSKTTYTGSYRKPNQ